MKDVLCSRVLRISEVGMPVLPNYFMPRDKGERARLSFTILTNVSDARMLCHNELLRHIMNL